RFDKIDELILKKENEIVALKNAKEISAKDGFAEIALPSSPQIGIFSKALETLSQTAAKAVALHAKTLDSRTDTIERNAEKWIEAGVTYLQSETCPFCTQNTTGIDLVSSYQSYFSKAYKELKDDIRQHLKANDDRFGPKPLLAVQNNISGNIALTEFWKRFFEVKLGELPVPDVVQAFNALYTQMKTSLNAKSASPLDVVDATGSLNAALTEYHNLLAKGTTYNTSCKAMNEHVMKVKARAVGGNLAAAITDLSKLKNTKVRHEPFAAALCKEFLDLKRQKTAFDVEKEQAKSDLDKHSATIFSLYEVTMNDHLKLFGAEFLLANTSGNYVGGKPNSSYNITINTVPVDVDATIGKHCFKSALSGGDKSCLALAFFLARLDHDPRLADKIVVFDDPMCSMDRFRSDRTVKAIAELSGKAKQVVVLSHDSQFLRRIFDEVPPGNRKALCVQRVGAKESTLVEWDIVNATRSEYLQDYFALSDYLEKGVTGDMRALAVKIRVILEENLRMRFPDVFGSGQWLGNFLEAIRNANSGEVAYSMKPHLSELDALNDFSKKFHHAENPGASKECRFRSETVPVFQFDCLIGC
ncbi:MAG TPA: AAA family ATPase, partial [Pirellula sp.]|nr:AAA family ATPase [Pirellula sp.]